MTDRPVAKEVVVLLHGIGRTGLSMWGAARYFRKRGYETLNVTYPSRRLGLDHLAQHLHDKALTTAFWRDGGRVHFVTHSMGGLLVRRYLENYRGIVPVEKLGRTVMLGPPNAGSEVADALHRLWLYRKIFGPAGQELTTMTAQPATPYYEVGIVAGTSSWLYPDALLFLRGPSDGRVTVARTRLAGMKDHVAIRVSHGMLALSPRALRHALTFIQIGSFGGSHEK